MPPLSMALLLMAMLWLPAPALIMLPCNALPLLILTI